jgi:hypothetical protein
MAHFGFAVPLSSSARYDFVRVLNQILAGGGENSKMKPDKKSRAGRPGA